MLLDSKANSVSVAAVDGVAYYAAATGMLLYHMLLLQ